MVKAENFLPVLRAPPSRGAHSLCIPQKTSPMGNEFLGRKAEKGEGTCRWSPSRRTCAGVWRRRLSACWTRAFHYTVCLLSVSGDLGQQSPDKSLGGEEKRGAVSQPIRGPEETLHQQHKLPTCLSFLPQLFALKTMDSLWIFEKKKTS